MTNEMQVQYLNFLTRSYEEVTETIKKVKQMIQSIPGEGRSAEFDTLLKGQEKVDGLETVKGRCSRDIERELKNWDIWTDWLEKIDGIGPYIAARLIVLFYYRFRPCCKDCGGILEKREARSKDGQKEIRRMYCEDCGKAADDGLLKYRLEYKDFPTISKWWAYMGRHTVDGTMPKRKAGVVSNWSTRGRTLGFHIGDQFNRQKDDHPYKRLLLERKAKRQKDHPEWSKGHIHNAAKNETVKIFLAHFWTVAREMDGKDVSEPYAGAIMGHTDIVDPPYRESDCLSETHNICASRYAEAAIL